MTNYERISKMDVDQMGAFLADEVPHGDCYGCDLKCFWFSHEKEKEEPGCVNAWTRWLKEEYKEE